MHSSSFIYIYDAFVLLYIIIIIILYRGYRVIRAVKTRTTRRNCRCEVPFVKRDSHTTAITAACPFRVRSDIIIIMLSRFTIKSSPFINTMKLFYSTKSRRRYSYCRGIRSIKNFTESFTVNQCLRPPIPRGKRFSRKLSTSYLYKIEYTSNGWGPVWLLFEGRRLGDFGSRRRRRRRLESVLLRRKNFECDYYTIHRSNFMARLTSYTVLITLKSPVKRVCSI